MGRRGRDGGGNFDGVLSISWNRTMRRLADLRFHNLGCHS